MVGARVAVGWEGDASSAVVLIDLVLGGGGTLIFCDVDRGSFGPGTDGGVTVIITEEIIRRFLGPPLSFTPLFF